MQVQGEGERQRGAIVHLWMGRDDICELLSITKRTLYNRVNRGQIERNRQGHKTLYRPVKMQGATQVKAEVQVQVQGAKEVQITGAPFTSSEPVLELTAIAEPDHLVGLVERLTDKVALLERERAEAVTIGHMLADEREQLRTENQRQADELGQLNAIILEAASTLAQSNADVRRLHDTIDGLVDGVVEVSSDWKAVPIRGRLRTILAGV